MGTEAAAPTKTELLNALMVGIAKVAALQTLPREQFSQRHDENGWTGHQVLAHVAAMEWTYPRLIDLARASQSSPDESPVTPTMQGGLDAYNARQVAKRANATVAELIDEFARNREATIAAVAAIDDDLWLVPVRSAGGHSGPLAAVLWTVAIDHVATHAREIAMTGRR